MSETLYENIVSCTVEARSIRLLPSLLFLIGDCRTSIGDCLTWNRKHQTRLTFRAQGGSDLIRSNDLMDTADSNHVWTNSRPRPGRGSSYVSPITAGSESGSAAGLLSTGVWPALRERLDSHKCAVTQHKQQSFVPNS